MILNYYKPFLDVVYNKLKALNINTTEFKIDHIAYQTDSTKDYEDKVNSFNGIAEKFSEHIVGGRRVPIFKLDNPLEYNEQTFFVFELLEPKQGQIVESAWEHVEFLTNDSIEELMEKYPNINWNTEVINREEFPMLILELGDGLRAKFPRLGVLDELERQKNKIS